ncbi:MAG: hypothetical protein RLP12_06015, partial [Ekhidna sp.]
MTINIYHQVGHQPNWNVDSYVKDGVGDGLILSPVHQTMESITKLDQSVLRNSIFDPQYYLPNSQKTKLKSYPFFPEVIADGFSTTDYSLVAIDSAKQCVDFQLEMDFESLIIPTRYIDQMISDYFDKQEAYTVIPFIKTVQQIGSSKPVYLTAALTSHMIIDEGFRERILNWITNFPEISGIYILVSFDRQTKQINSSEFLHSYLSLLNEIRSTGLEFVAGHLNTESIILSLVDEGTFSFGSFENTRIFSLDKFV